MFKIYWTEKDNTVHGRETPELVAALQITKEKRDAGNSFVTMVSENKDHVGKPGVDEIIDRKTPDGQNYDWEKSSRAGKPRKSDRIVTKNDF